ncbi:MAG: 30S ribosomal protein S17 [Planctomycetota bacterium]|jgi:small subunit ribosomal protein S17
MTNDVQDNTPAQRKARTGTVASISGDKTISVTVQDLVRHPRYEKFVRHRTKLAVHDARNEASVGDVVEIVPCRRLSKSKAFRLLRVVRTSELG